MIRFIFHIFTEFRKDDDVLCVALRTGHFGCAFSLLFLVYPPLETKLMDPLGGSLTPTRPDPWGTTIIILSSETHPAGFPKYIIL